MRTVPAMALTRPFCALLLISCVAAQRFSAQVGPGLTQPPLPAGTPRPPTGASASESVSLGQGAGISGSASLGGHGAGASGHVSLGGQNDNRGTVSGEAAAGGQYSGYDHGGYGVDASGHAAGGQASGSVSLGDPSSEYDPARQQYGPGNGQYDTRDQAGVGGQYDGQQGWEGDNRQQPGQDGQDRYEYPTEAPQVPDQHSGYGDRNEEDRRSGTSYDPRTNPRTDPRYAPSQYPGYDTSRGDPRQDPSRGDPRYDASRGDPRYDPRQQGGGSGALYPVTLKTFVLSENSIFVYWVDPYNQKGRGQQQQGGNTRYTVKYSKGYGGAGSENTQETAEKELRLTDLEPGTDYSFSVKVDRDGRSSGWSAPVRNRTLEQLPLQPPSNIKVDTRDRDATVTLSAPDGMKGHVSQYLFLYAPSGGSSGSRQWTEQQVSGYSYDGRPVTVVLRNLQPDEEYFYTVQAINSRGSGPFSEIQSFKVPGYGYPPGPGGSAYRPGYGGPTTPGPYNRYPGHSWDQQTTPSPYPGAPAPYYPPEPAPYYPEDPRYEQTTEDYYARYYTSTPDYYNRGQQETTSWGPYWGAAAGSGASASGQGASAGGSASVSGSYGNNNYGGAYGGSHGSSSSYSSSGDASAAGGSGAAPNPNAPPPTDLKAENLEGGLEILLTYNPPTDVTAKFYDIYYSDNPNTPDDQWQKEQAIGEDLQAVFGVNQYQKQWIYIKMRTVTAEGAGEFSQAIPHFVDEVRPPEAAAGDRSREGQDQRHDQEHEQSREGDAQAGAEHDQEDQYAPEDEESARHQPGHAHAEADARHSGRGGVSVSGQASAGGVSGQASAGTGGISGHAGISGHGGISGQASLGGGRASVGVSG
ncbi:spidroin-2-like [Paramacrobiotus metropolitanus]|uniref:spidroin-2-like n=1 Tax=Paramacrobiotus metropolitanus TaxID=2943436 RepID=UPI0024457897|nr:spidroin-2-like [Paramacrobiotus metropolitanus]